MLKTNICTPNGPNFSIVWHFVHPIRGSKLGSLLHADELVCSRMKSTEVSMTVSMVENDWCKTVALIADLKVGEMVSSSSIQWAFLHSLLWTFSVRSHLYWGRHGLLLKYITQSRTSQVHIYIYLHIAHIQECDGNKFHAISQHEDLSQVSKEHRSLGQEVRLIRYVSLNRYQSLLLQSILINPAKFAMMCKFELWSMRHCISPPGRICFHHSRGYERCV